MNIELFSNAPVTTLEHYRSMGRNAAQYARGETPEPIIVPVDGQALSARYHVRVAMLYAIETSLVVPDADPLDLAFTIGQGGLAP
jgi:propanediol dehydratase large subunit